MSTKPIEVSELRKTFSTPRFLSSIKTEALKGVNFSVGKNEIFSLIGLNGSGKTTTIKILLGLIKQDGGTYSISGSGRITPEVKKTLGYLPEIPYFEGVFTPVEMLRFWGGLSGLSGSELKKRIPLVLEYTSLTRAASRKLKGFSRGMLQRLGIAQALLAEPDILILDEPMGGLDPMGIKTIREFMQSLKETGKTVFFSSHIISEVEKVADRVAMIHDGRIIKITRPHKHLEEEFIESIEEFDKNVKPDT